jgi:hypothetical protein
VVVLIVLIVDVTTGFVDGLEVLVVDFTVVDGFFVVVVFVVVFVVGFVVVFVVDFGVVVVGFGVVVVGFNVVVVVKAVGSLTKVMLAVAGTG